MLLVGCGGLQPAGVAQGPIPQGQMLENPSRVSGVRQSPRSVRHGSVTETVLHSFRGYSTDGSDPESGLTYFKGTFYGTTYGGGSSRKGTVYSITPSGTETVVHSFKGGKDGIQPEARLIVRNGTLYGTTVRGGGCQYRSGCGTVFSITPSGHETVLHGFAGPPDGLYPKARLLDVNGTLYGTTTFGFGGANCAPIGCGTVFNITSGGKEKVLYSFRAGNDGAYPFAGLIDVKGTLYGTTPSGGGYGTNYCGYRRPGCGTVFTITPSGKEKVLHSFGNGKDGIQPGGGLVEVKGTLYGATGGGGAYSTGTVYSITPGGKEKVLNSSHGAAATLLSVNGTLYGTTGIGGSYGYGTVFSITLSGYETVLHSFGGSGQDGAYPYSGVIDVNGTLYGTTNLGGAFHDGTVFSLTL
jgi:uncharacterized repeat protein (TIGR03803 family)